MPNLKKFVFDAAQGEKWAKQLRDACHTLQSSTKFSVQHKGSSLLDIARALEQAEEIVPPPNGETVEPFEAHLYSKPL